jgi:hypothetical protein
MPTYNHFYDLPVYKTCRAFRKQVSSIAREYFPKSEEYHLKAQVLDSVDQLRLISQKALGVFTIRKISSFAGTPEVHLTKPWNI